MSLIFWSVKHPSRNGYIVERTWCKMGALEHQEKHKETNDEVKENVNKREGYAFAFETPGRFKQVAKADKTGTDSIRVQSAEFSRAPGWLRLDNREWCPEIQQTKLENYPKQKADVDVSRRNLIRNEAHERVYLSKSSGSLIITMQSSKNVFSGSFH
ncbi:hypothetical protein KQX54_004772 [Cotesia glomerata]|uniref:Uncharacterized protein n=1 Tax=Cotesia glomerata TaxID=32391 RepID=A0AAV7I5C1_COTGL|nr:hypothetical protein KQX54_004772 [Cotesia glomerata]